MSGLDYDALHSATPKSVNKICCIGAGHVGGTLSAVIASNRPEITVTVVDKDEKKIQAWNLTELPIHEPGLPSVVKGAHNIPTPGSFSTQNLFFSTDIGSAIRDADVIIIAVNMPLAKPSYINQARSDMSNFQCAVRDISEHSTSDKIVVVKSTVPCGTSQALSQELLRLSRAGIRFDVLSSPEFSAQGTAVSNLTKPDRILVGFEYNSGGYTAAATWRRVFMWVDNDRFVWMNLQSAELAKLAANSMLAQRVSNINSISVLCEKTGADLEKVALACGLDTRIGPGMLKASIGFGGSCLGKDVAAMARVEDECGLGVTCQYWESINTFNEHHIDRQAASIAEQLDEVPGNVKKVAVLGCAYKRDTGDASESPALSIAAYLLQHRGCEVAMYDPMISSLTILDELTKKEIFYQGDLQKGRLSIWKSPYDACKGAAVVVIGTDWPMLLILDKLMWVGDSAKFETYKYRPILSSQVVEENCIDWATIAEVMKEPKVVFDGHNTADENILLQLGFKLRRLGRAFNPEQQCKTFQDTTPTKALHD